MHDSRAVANEILTIARAENKSLTLMQLLKLVYLAHGWRLTYSGNPLTKDLVEAWQRGPVYRNVYSAFSGSGSNPINGLAYIPGTSVPYSSKFSAEEMDIIKQVVGAYGHVHAFDLSNMTHKPNTPWTLTFNKDGQYAVIPNVLIKEHFTKLRNREIDQRSA